MVGDHAAFGDLGVDAGGAVDGGDLQGDLAVVDEDAFAGGVTSSARPGVGGAAEVAVAFDAFLRR